MMINQSEIVVKLLTVGNNQWLNYGLWVYLFAIILGGFVVLGSVLKILLFNKKCNGNWLRNFNYYN